ncbi:hypothetical protein MSLAZ_1559 [Methanosarcina lacustris Z-7289]|uniref:Uncharacterized protein n=1 Tax=Methanosarcina lacustris Z-7289 TaxID=1434111 RepID=A0A0E3WRQ0_9EURY|nr:hypothetical protein MSLAZ_1559 [Methanosarcina lacustris Z-7289]
MLFPGSYFKLKKLEERLSASGASRYFSERLEIPRLFSKLAKLFIRAILPLKQIYPTPAKEKRSISR